jgi:predicted ATPase
LFLNRFGGKGIYLLDEPEAALSPARQLAFLRIIHQLVNRDNAQFIIATHSPILLGYPKAKIFSFDSVPIESVRYEDTEHYQITKAFLNRTDKFLEDLFCDDEKQKEKYHEENKYSLTYRIVIICHFRISFVSART